MAEPQPLADTPGPARPPREAALSKPVGLALFLAMALLFLVANRGAYKGYFQDDELDNLSWAPFISNTDFLEYLVTPRFLRSNFRPVGHYYFHVMGRYFDLDFPKYVFPIHAIHLLNVWLLWLLLRRLELTRFAAGAGCLFYAFHMAVFDVLWKPMYVFDLLCATFCLLSLYLYTRRWMVASFLTFWLAYKSKELAVMLPAVLLCYEYWFGKRRWLPLIPFFAVSLSFGLQALWANRLARPDDYTLHLEPAGIYRTARFYASAVLLLPLAGFALPFVPLVHKDRRVWFGLAAMFLFFVPLALLSSRLFQAYCYVPLVGLAIAVAAIAMTRYRVLVAVFFLFWIPWNEITLRLDRRQALAIDDENRAYVTALAEATRANPDTRVFVYDARPYAMNVWGIEGALKIFYRRNDLTLLNIEDPGARQALAGERVMILSWDALRRKLFIAARRPGVPDASYLTMDGTTPLWQLEDGWYRLENTFRWTQPEATARLRRPPQARQFELRVNISPDLLRDLGHTSVQASLNGQPVGSADFTASGWHTLHWDLPPAPPGQAELCLRVAPAFQPSKQDPRLLGVAVGGFGFLPRE